MNDLVKTSIEGRKNAIFSAYEITDESIKAKIDDLFSRINEFGENCTDNMDFETKFASSSLNQEYIQLFTDIATTCTPIVRKTEERHVKSDSEYIADEVASEIRYQAKEATLPARRVMHEEALKAARNTPVVGEVMQATQIADLFGGFKRAFGKKKKEDKENTKDSNKDEQKD